MKSIDEYQRAVSPGAVTPEASKGRMMLTYAMALNGEAAEYAELMTLVDPTLANLANKAQVEVAKFCKAVKDTVFHREPNYELLKAHARVALGSVLRTVCASATCLGLQMSDVLAGSLPKAA